MKTFKMLAFAFVLLLQSAVYSQDVPDQTFTVFLDPLNGITADDAVKSALEKNDELNAVRKEAEASEKLVVQAGQRARLMFETGGQQDATQRAYGYMVQGAMPLELGGRRRSRVLTAQREFEVKQLAVEQAEAALAAKVRDKYGESLALVLKLDLLEELLDSLEESYRLIQARVEEGKTAPLEEKMMLVEVNRVRAMREMSESKARVSLLELRSMIGMEPSTPLRLYGSFGNTLTNFPGSGELTRQALALRPDLNILRAMEDLADAKIRMTDAEGKIDAAATVGYQRMRMNDMMQFNYIVFGIRFMLPYKNRSRDAIEAEVIGKEAMEKRREFGELVIKQEVAKSLVRYESAVRAREITSNGVVDQANRNLDVVRQMYELGSNSLLDYLAEQRRVVELRDGLIDAELEVYLSRVEVLRAVNSPELVTR